MIRELTVEELPLCPPLGQEFYATGAFPGQMIPAIFVATWTTLIESGMGVIFGLFDRGTLVGVIGAVKYPDANDGVVVASEMFWFVSAPFRRGTAALRLFDEYEEWAKRIGAGRIGMIHLQALAPEVLKKLYLRRGYTEVETHYMKTL